MRLETSLQPVSQPILTASISLGLARNMARGTLSENLQNPCEGRFQLAGALQALN